MHNAHAASCQLHPLVCTYRKQYVLSACTPATFLPSAIQQVVDGDTLPYVQRSSALGRSKLVAHNSQHVHALWFELHMLRVTRSGT